MRFRDYSPAEGNLVVELLIDFGEVRLLWLSLELLGRLVGYAFFVFVSAVGVKAFGFFSRTELFKLPIMPAVSSTRRQYS